MGIENCNNDKPVEPAVLRAAAAWRLRLTELGNNNDAEFQLWLRAEDAHRMAWDIIITSWQAMERHHEAPELRQRSFAALQRARNSAARPRSGSVLWRMTRTREARMICAVLLLAVGCLMWLLLPRSDHFSTSASEQRTVRLKDGSEVQLDTSTDLRVHYTSELRQIDLVAGQARFNVAHDRGRPFIVLARGERVEATGTSFNIELLGSGTIVTMIEGTVLARGTDGKGGEFATSLHAGQQLVGLANTPTRVENADSSAALAWQQGRLIVANEPLAIVVERVRRYVRVPILITDRSLGERRLSGVFEIASLNRFSETLSQLLPVNVDAASGAILISPQGEPSGQNKK